MKRIFNCYVMATLALLLGFGLSAKAQSSDEPAIVIHTNAYLNDGELNEFTLMIGANKEGQYVDVDCGYGKVEYELKLASFDDESSSLQGTAITCKVSPAGVVKIYCDDPTAIDYFNGDGCSIAEIDLSKCTSLGILSLKHNELTGLDLTPNTSLKAIYISDNEFSEATPLVIGANKPNLTILEMSIIKYMDPAFNMSDYPNLMSLDVYHNVGITALDPTGCPKLMRLSADLTHIKSIDVSQNPELLILNVSDTGVSELDLSNNTKLQQLYCSHESGSFYTDVKISSLDLSHNPALVYLFCSGNKLTSLDVTGCSDLTKIYANNNYITALDLSQNPALFTVKIQQNCMDFATLPFDPGTWDEYEYEQRPMKVAKSYPVGAQIDLSSRVLRDDLPTYCTLFSVSDEAPDTYTPVNSDNYTYNNGVVTLNKAMADSLLLGFTCDEFPNMVLYTTKFKVKSESDYGKPSKLISFSPSVTKGTEMSFAIGVAGATEDNPAQVSVDFGDGILVPFSIATSVIPDENNIAGTRAGYGTMAIYADDEVEITAFATEGIKMFSFDCTRCSSLNRLRVVGAGLSSINLERNRCLKTLDLSDNKLTAFKLMGINEYFNKNFLTDLNLSNNKIADIEFTTLAMLHRVDLSNNQIAQLDFSDADFIEELNIAGNLFTEVNVLHCTALKKLNFSGNKVSSWIEPEENNIEELNLSYNNFTLSTLPARSALLTEENYDYAPQNVLTIATKGPCADLTAQLRDIDGATTQFAWLDAGGNTLTEGVDYTIANGYTRFLDPAVGKMLHCEMSHPYFPDFAGDKLYCTTVIEAATMPTHKLAEFSTVNSGESVSLSLAAETDGTALYIDWNGDGNVTQYLLGTSYRLFDATTKGKKAVGVYTYEPEERISVFSMKGATLSSFDGSGLTDAICINISNAKLSQITLPQSSKLRELILDNNSLASFDLSPLPNLYMLSLNGNMLTSLDLSKAPELGLASIANNRLTSITLDNPQLWQLYLSGNKLSTVSLSGAPSLQQLTLADNLLAELDLSPLSQLRAVSIDHNYFRFSTLPPVLPQYSLYQYHSQYPVVVEPVEGKVDLSSEAVINGNGTEYIWYIDMPYVNEEGELEGEDLIEGTEYTIENGVTTFQNTFDNLICVMLNSEFPDLIQYTNYVNVTELGVDGIASSADTRVAVNGNTISVTAPEGVKVALVAMNGTVLRASKGSTTMSGVEPGAYLVLVGTKAYKLAIR